MIGADTLSRNPLFTDPTDEDTEEIVMLPDELFT